MVYLLKNTNFFITIIALIQSLLIILISQIVFISENFEMLKKFLPMVNLVVLVLTASVMFFIKETENNIKRKTETKLLEAHLKQIEDLVTVLQMQKHEYARHIQIIQAMLYTDELSSVKDYIDGISKNYHHSEDITYVGNPALTALLNSKRKVAEINNINFDFAIKCDITDVKIPSWDLCSIIGNLLDNAFEATSLKNGDRNVGLEIKVEDKKYKIFVYNNGPEILPGEQNLIFEEGYTTKNSKFRGYGLYIVKSLVNQYRGQIELRSNKKTAFIVSLPADIEESGRFDINVKDIVIGG